MIDSFSYLSIEIVYSNFTFCGAYTLSFLEPHTISAKRAQPRMSLKSDSVVLRSISRWRTYSKPVESALQSSYAGYSVWDKS